MHMSFGFPLLVYLVLGYWARLHCSWYNGALIKNRTIEYRGSVQDRIAFLITLMWRSLKQCSFTLPNPTLNFALMEQLALELVTWEVVPRMLAIESYKGDTGHTAYGPSCARLQKLWWFLWHFLSCVAVYIQAGEAALPDPESTFNNISCFYVGNVLTCRRKY